MIFPSRILLWCLAGAIMAADCGLHLVYTQAGVGVVGIPVVPECREKVLWDHAFWSITMKEKEVMQLRIDSIS